MRGARDLRYAAPMPDARLHADDFYAWTQDQAARLRELAATRPNGAVDFDLIAEEIEDMGSERLDGVLSQLENILAHLVLLATEPDAPAADHWRHEVREFHFQATRRHAPSMDRRIAELWPRTWRNARKRLELKLAREGRETPPLPEECPVGPEDLLGEWIAVADLVERFSRAR